jgi:hypothetical protein
MYYSNEEYVRYYSGRLDQAIYHHRDFIPQFHAQVNGNSLTFLKYDGSEFTLSCQLADYALTFPKLLQNRMVQLPDARLERTQKFNGDRNELYVISWTDNQIHFREVGTLHRGLVKKLNTACHDIHLEQSGRDLLETCVSFIDFLR